MQKFAVIDIGSNSVRLMFVADGKVLYKDLCSTRLGEGIADTRLLKDDAITRTAQAVVTFYKKANTDGATQVFAFATAAVRSAKNGQAFVDKVKTLCGLKVEVVSGEEEAELGILGALGNQDGALIDIGGASTELIIKENNTLVYKKSVDIGVVRIKDAGDNAVKLMENALIEFGEVPLKSTVYAIGGTATTIASQVLQLTAYDSNLISGTKITTAQIIELVEKWQTMPVQEIARLPCMPKGRADIILGGAVWLVTLMNHLKIDEIIVSDSDNLEGYAKKRGLLK